MRPYWFITALVVLLLSATALTADWYAWTTANVSQYVPDPDNGLSPGKEVLGVWWGRDDDYDYFRLDLEAYPSVGDYAEVYGVYLFSAPGQGADSSNPYVPDGAAFDGNDAIVDQYFVLGEFNLGHVRTWDGPSGPGGGPTAGWYSSVANSQLLTSGPGIEWRIPLGTLPSEFTFVGAGFAPSSSVTFDGTSGGVTPEPATWALLALGLPLVVWRRRRR